MRSRFNAFSPIIERFTFPLWTVSILRICLNIKKEGKKSYGQRNINTHKILSNFYFKNKNTEISKSLKSFSIIFLNFYFNLWFFPS